MNDDTFVGKRILVGLSYLDASGDLTEQIQLHGLISRISKHSLYFDRSDGGGEFSIPFEGKLEAGIPNAVYTLRSTGEEVSGVDYVVSWTVHARKDEN